MGLFDMFRKREQTEEVINESSVSDPLLEALIKGTEIDRTTVMEIPSVSEAVDLISNTFAMIPFKLYKYEEKEGKKTTKEVDDPRVSLINDDTGDKLDGFQFKKAMCEDYLMGKGGYAYIKKSGNNFKGLFYVEDKEITIEKNSDPIFKNYDIMVQGQPYRDYNFVKLLRNTKDGASGKGITTELAKALKTAFARLSYEYDLTVTGGSRKGFIKSQKHLDEKAIKALKEAWEKYYNGNANTVILNDGMEFQEASNSSKENEINQKNITFNDEVKGVFHTRGDYDTFIKSAVMPIATAFVTALNRDFLLEREKESFYFAPDTKELLKGALKERYEAYQIAIKNGFKTRNEIRYLEDDDAIDGLDMVSLGLGDVLLNAETGEIYTPNTNSLVKMGEKSTEIVQNGAKAEENAQENEKTVQNEPKLPQNEPNVEDLEAGGAITPEEEKKGEKGGENE